MTIKQAIDRVDKMSPNAYSRDIKIAWLSTLDDLIYTKIILTHEGAPDDGFTEYDEDTPLDTGLLVSEPYSEIYYYWLRSKIDEANGEYNGYNNNSAHYNAWYSDFEAYYNRTHMPITKGREVYF